MIDLKKTPKWLLIALTICALAFLIFLFYMSMHGRKVTFWPPSIDSGDAIDLGRPAQLVKLTNFPEVLTKASEIIEKADSELWMAVDVPGYGAISQTEIFRRYQASLYGLASKPKIRPDTHILWLSPDALEPYHSSIEKLSGDQFKKATEADLTIRGSVRNPTESDLQVLAFNSFWIVKDKDGVYHSVVCWFTSQPGSSSDMVGFYSTSPDLAFTLKNVWQMWEGQSKAGYSNRIARFMGPKDKQPAR